MIHAGHPESASTEALAVIAAVLEERTGQQTGAHRNWRIEAALKPVLRAHGMATLDVLATALARGRDEALTRQVVEAMLNQETSFFRDAAVFDLIADAVEAMQREASGRRLRIWCAGCATGQEPYSLAMLLWERIGEAGGTMPEILATDISAAAITRARSGHYTQFEIQRGLSVRRMMTWFDTVGANWVARPELVRMVRFREANLVHDVPLPGRFDLLLCRNVLLYFSAGLRKRVFARLAQTIRPDGLLVLGAGGTVVGQSDALTPSQRFRGMYRLVDESMRASSVA